MHIDLNPIWFLYSSKVQDPTVESTEKRIKKNSYPHMYIVVEKLSFEFLSSQKHKEL